LGKHQCPRQRVLILVPTEYEQGFLSAASWSPGDVVELCGFGLVVAGIRTALLLQQFRPREVLLLGIAGALTDELKIGRAYRFGQVACYGVGAGTGSSFLPAGQMGWKHWPRTPEISDLICLDDPECQRMLVSSTAASSSTDEANGRTAIFPAAKAEDMEAFAVAAACRLAGLPLRIIRGISNRAGIREPSSWRVAEAMQSALVLATEGR
jgi:futalosine hydrolase